MEALKVANKLFETPELLEKLINIRSILEILNNENSVKVFEKLLTVPELLNNPYNISNIIRVANNDYSLQFLERILKEQEILNSNPNYISALITKTEFDIINKTKLELFNEWVKNPNYLSDENLTAEFFNAISTINQKTNRYEKISNEGHTINFSKLDFETVQRGGVFENLFLSLPNYVSNKFYDMYLEKAFLQYTPAEANRFRQMCKSINEEYGVKVILPSDLKEVGQSLILIYQELNNYKMHSKGCANMPPILSFITPEVTIGNKVVAGEAAAHTTREISILQLTTADVKNTLRHEMAHINDTKLLEDFPVEIRSFNKNLETDWRGKPKFDVDVDLNIDNCKYVEELRKAGITEYLVRYAYTDPKEFLAVASSGDFSKYSPEFKSYLVELGMPEWMLNFQNLKPFFINGDNAKVADNSASVHLESVTNNTSNPRMINSEDNISPSETIQMQKDNKALPFETEVIQKENFSEKDLKIIKNIKTLVPEIKNDNAISILKQEKFNKITFETKDGIRYDIIQYNNIDINNVEKHIKSIIDINFKDGDLIGGHCIETYQRLTLDDIRQILKIGKNEDVKINIIRNINDLTISVIRLTGGGVLSKQKIILEYQDGNPPFYRIKSVKENSFGELIEKSSQHPKSLVSESIANEILELMQTRPKECLSYYIFTNERGQSYQVFEYKGMCYIQQITKQEELISFYPISKEDLKRIYPEVIIDKIPIWK